VRRANRAGQALANFAAADARHPAAFAGRGKDRPADLAARLMCRSGSSEIFLGI